MWLKIGNWWKIVDASFNIEGITFQTCNWIRIYFFKELLARSWVVCNGWPTQPLLLLVICLSKTRKWHFSAIQINLLQEMLMICTGEILFEWLNNYHPKIKGQHWFKSKELAGYTVKLYYGQQKVNRNKSTWPISQFGQ